MLDVKTKTRIKAKLYPKADQTVFAPVEEALNQYLCLGVRVLDAGCGKGTWILRAHQQTIGLLIGLDSEAPEEREIDRYIVGDLQRLPLTDDTFDVIICYNAIEHLKQPKQAFAEFGRILKEGGILIFKTPCVMSPAFFLSRCLPLSWHKKFKGASQRTQEKDVFLTYYRCNTRKRLDHTLKSVGFQRETLVSIEQIYDYFTFNRIAYAAGLLVGRIMQLVPWTRPFRSQLIGVYHKLPYTEEARGKER